MKGFILFFHAVFTLGSLAFLGVVGWAIVQLVSWAITK